MRSTSNCSESFRSFTKRRNASSMVLVFTSPLMTIAKRFHIRGLTVCDFVYLFCCVAENQAACRLIQWFLHDISIIIAPQKTLQFKLPVMTHFPNTFKPKTTSSQRLPRTPSLTVQQATSFMDSTIALPFPYSAFPLLTDNISANQQVRWMAFHWRWLAFWMDEGEGGNVDLRVRSLRNDLICIRLRIISLAISPSS